MFFKIYFSIRTKFSRSLLNFQIESFHLNKKPFFSSFLRRVCGKFSVFDHPIGDILMSSLPKGWNQYIILCCIIWHNMLNAKNSTNKTM